MFKAIEQIPKIVVRKGISPISPTPQVNKEAVITPVTPIITPIAIEKQRQEIMKSLAPKTDFLASNQAKFQAKFSPDPFLKLRAIDMQAPLGQIASTPRAMPVTKDVTNRMRIKGILKISDEPVILETKPIFRKTSEETVKATDKTSVSPEKVALSPKTKTLIQTLLPIVAIVSTAFLRK